MTERDTRDDAAQDAPTSHEDGTPLPLFRLSMTLLVDAHGTDVTDASHRAMAALRVPSGPFRGAADEVSGPGQRWICHARVPWAQMHSWRRLDEPDPREPLRRIVALAAAQDKRSAGSDDTLDDIAAQARQLLEELGPGEL